MDDKLKQIIIDLKDAHKSLQESKKDVDFYSFAERRFIGFLRALAVALQDEPLNINELKVGKKILDYYIRKL